MTSLFFLFLYSYGMSSRSRRMKPATLLRCSWALTAVGAATARWAWVGSSHARPMTLSSPSTTPVGREKTQTCPRETCESCVFFPATCKYHKSQQQQQTLPTPSKNSFGQSLSYQAHAFLHTKVVMVKLQRSFSHQPVVSQLWWCIGQCGQLGVIVAWTSWTGLWEESLPQSTGHSTFSKVVNYSERF